MAGGKGKIHEHPNAGISTFRERKDDINRSGANRKTFASFNKKCKANGLTGLTQKQYIETLSYLYELTEIEVKQLADDKDQPLALRLLIAELTDPQSRGKTLQDLRNYLFSQGVEKTETTTTIINLGSGKKPKNGTD